MSISNHNGGTGRPLNAGDRKGRTNMQCYDMLPKGIRVALANADHNWSAAQIHTFYRKRHPKVRTVALACAAIRESDNQRHWEGVAEGHVCPDQRPVPQPY